MTNVTRYTRWVGRGSRPVRIANCSGGRNDPGYQMRRQVEQGDVDFIMGDYLAEVSLAENAEAARRGENEVWFPTCWDGIQQSIDIIFQKNIKVIVNGGGLNPAGLARKVQKLVLDKKYNLRVAYVSGDDIYQVIQENLQKAGKLPQHLDSNNLDVHLHRLAESFVDIVQKPVVSANAYLGARAIVKALEAGTDIIICGRVADASPVIGAAWWWHGWNDTNYDELAGALIAGHLIECSGYVTGGNFSGFDRFDLDQLVDLPFGIAEIDAKGACVITMHDTGKGVVDEDIVRCQFLYELQGAIYLNSDVTADATDVEITEVGKNRVQVSGVKGVPPPPTTKVAVFYRGGYQCQLLLNATGYNTEKKWELLEKQIKYVLMQKRVLDKFDALEFQVLGISESNPRNQFRSTTYCRIFAQASEESVCMMLRSSWAEFVMQHFSGMHYSLDFRTAAPVRYNAYYPALYPQDCLEEFAHILAADGSLELSIHAGHPPKYAEVTARVNFDAELAYKLKSLELKTVQLGDIALARSGDKGANIDFGVFPKKSAMWPWFREFMSRAKLQELMGEDWRSEYFIERMEFPKIFSVHFVIYGPLGRGSSSSVLLDNLGKGFADYIRAKFVDIPIEMLAL